ncbi:hypothetical protein RvY_01739 [Ramazzottius varieornatus]|uniref:Carbonic anhydrase n=1 Tax=Ramazzottius varieornatus TaxID=947166 RepID=A0A1D1UL76_RAMVA|nr:hypothetical protein RvY_01739 [Ramazzottius varieornatus]
MLPHLFIFCVFFCSYDAKLSTAASAGDSLLGNALATSGVTTVPRWGYREKADELTPLTWQVQYPVCGTGERQSPIDIESNAVQVDRGLQPIRFTNYQVEPVDAVWQVVNNGQVVQLSSTGFPKTATPGLTDGSFNADYEFLQLHFHWGASDDLGSEHVIDGRHYPIELHIVHQKVRDTNPQDSTGLTVLGVLFEVAPTGSAQAVQNPNFQLLMQAVGAVVDPGPSINMTLRGFSLDDLLPTSLKGSTMYSDAYYRYLGSLTTPPCSETVVWSVLKDHLFITEEQMQTFRRLRKRAGFEGPDNRLSGNFRPVQRLNGRIIRMYDPSGMIMTSNPRPGFNRVFPSWWRLVEYPRNG